VIYMATARYHSIVALSGLVELVPGAPYGLRGAVWGVVAVLGSVQRLELSRVGVPGMQSAD
jgi:hypothetical protein